MDFNDILMDIKPERHEEEKIQSLSKIMINYINELAQEKGINALAILVGSVAKGTWLSGKADIDIFIHFPLETPLEELKVKGLFLGHQCIKKMKGTFEERYASHPYVTGHIQGYDVDFVPCYAIKTADDLKSAVDRTILHTEYINKHLQREQIDEVLLLKKFMEGIETYGSEFKVGGFAGYLCELLILEYGSFKEVLEASSSLWKSGFIIDLEDYGTGVRFTEPLVVVDPTDKNRNVAAALNIQKMSEFIVASRNFLQDPKTSYFYPLSCYCNNKDIEAVFEDRGTKTILIIFKPPKIPADAIYPQLKKTEQSLESKLNYDGFNVINCGSWTDESGIAIISLELDVWFLSKYKKHVGPKVFSRIHQERFLDKYNQQAWVENDQWVVNVERKHRTPESFLEDILTPENIHHLRIGKHLRKEILMDHKVMGINEFLKSDMCSNETLKFFFDFLNPGNHLHR
ncbi:CCA tRNA nucleotidyltransferase [Methanobacterium alcaliphilum]|uniref:CCA tRNA nucleotidyltransferase n=1 Tax=Methanobacterium alcaliphilum TaxID=392018 RepID=UPI00200A3945|nr:CCA tRNA nucleotidyltransferase [Methanobacterium alcaliphilum]MCK9152491.1 CCA tRNA nucleotidyltransferase [Methanobacterium alcaliphilum]